MQHSEKCQLHVNCQVTFVLCHFVGIITSNRGCCCCGFVVCVLKSGRTEWKPVSLCRKKPDGHRISQRWKNCCEQNWTVNMKKFMLIPLFKMICPFSDDYSFANGNFILFAKCVDIIIIPVIHNLGKILVSIMIAIVDEPRLVRSQQNTRAEHHENCFVF